MLAQIDSVLRENAAQPFQWKQRLERVFPTEQCVYGKELEELLESELGDTDTIEDHDFLASLDRFSQSLRSLGRSIHEQMAEL